MKGCGATNVHEQLWVDTLVKRYRDRQNLFMYTIANEFERYPDGQYRYDPSDVDWARRVAARIRKLDAVHPIGCHPSVWITDQDAPGQGARPFGSYKGFTQRRPQVVWPLWEGSEVNLNVTQNNEGVQRRSLGQLRRRRSWPDLWQHDLAGSRISSEVDGDRLGFRGCGAGGLHRRRLVAWQAGSRHRVRLSVRAGIRSGGELCDPPGPSTIHGPKESLEDRDGGRLLCRRF